VFAVVQVHPQLVRWRLRCLTCDIYSTRRLFWFYYRCRLDYAGSCLRLFYGLRVVLPPVTCRCWTLYTCLPSPYYPLFVPCTILTLPYCITIYHSFMCYTAGAAHLRCWILTQRKLFTAFITLLLFTFFLQPTIPLTYRWFTAGLRLALLY